MSLARERETRLIEIFSKLPRAQQEELIGIAELLGGGGATSPTVSAPPTAGPETVIGALRRLRRSYPDVDRRNLMSDACDIVSEHALDGVAAVEAIARLERLFARHAAVHVASGGRKR